VLDATVAWLRGRSADDRPFLAWVHFLSPHAPYTWREGSQHLYTGEYSGRYANTSGPVFDARDDDELARLRELYRGEVLLADSLFESLMDTVTKEGLVARTTILVTADHGEAFLEHGELQHQTLHDEVLRVPLLLRAPSAERGGHFREPVSHVDLLPTLAALHGLPVSAALDGIDLTGSGSRRDRSSRFVAGERLLLALQMTTPARTSAAAMLGSAKLIVDCGQPARPRLYDLEADPGERRDLAAADWSTARALATRLDTELGGAPCPVLEAAMRGALEESDLSSARQARLQALGYLGASRANGFHMALDPSGVCDAGGLGVVTVHWRGAPGEVRILVDDEGKLLAEGGSGGSVTTGRWVRPGTTFQAIDRSSAAVLGRISARGGVCSEEEGPHDRRTGSRPSVEGAGRGAERHTADS
jgi:hypothetical protein